MADVFHRSFFLDGTAGRLEALLWTATRADPEFVAVVCHPHPLFGGTMHNKVVYHTARALHERGAPVLRFNFRGTGHSEGEHDHGRGERDDLRAALDYLRAEYAGKPILLAGFSFGSWVSLSVGCEDDRVSRLMALGFPANRLDASYLAPCTKPKLFIQGANDPFGSREKLDALFETLAEPKRLVFIEGGDHFFAGHLDEVSRAIGAWLDEDERRSR
jgi:uncharacterized protein